MKIIVFGTTNWDSDERFNIDCRFCNKKEELYQWYNRVFKFIPSPEKVFITAGSESDVNINPLPVDLYQIGFKKTIRHSNQNNYFRLGLMTGIWKTLLDYPDFDLLIHIQCNRLLGRNFEPWLKEFMEREEQLMAFNFKSALPPGVPSKNDNCFIETGFMAMKRPAAQIYVAAGQRQCCDPNPYPFSCEEEAYSMFANSWWNPAPDILTIRQRDKAYEEVCNLEQLSIDIGSSEMEIKDIDFFKTLPIIAAGDNLTHEFYDEWLQANPLN